MTTAVATLDSPGIALVAGVHAGLDALAGFDPARLNVAEHGAFLAEVARAESRLAGLKLRALAAADRVRVGAASGAASTGQWVAQVANTDQVTAQRQVGLATGLRDRNRTEQALSRGAITADHAAVIVQADRQLPGGVTTAQRDAIEASLVEKAQVLAPAALRKAARRVLAEIESDVRVVDAHENEIVADEEARARARTRLTLHDNGDDTVTGHFTIPSAQGQLLTKIIQTITAPRRGRLGASVAQVGDPAVQTSGTRTDWDRARGEAFCELIEHLPTDHLHPRTAATLVVTIPESTLRGALAVAHLDTGGVLSAGEARRLACTSGLLPAVLGGGSQVLDLGRSARLYSEPQRLAIGIGHQHCAADGCERPFAWCELHHREHWSDGGSTDLDKAIPLCHFHHQRIHDQRYHHSEAPDGSIRFWLRT